MAKSLNSINFDIMQLKSCIIDGKRISIMLPNFLRSCKNTRFEVMEALFFKNESTFYIPLFEC